MPRVALVADSTCDLPEEERRKHVTSLVPLHVQVGGADYLDRVDLDPASFFELFRRSGQIARSSQPSVGAFADVYTGLLEHYDSVVSIHLSSRLSGTVQSAAMAAEAVDPVRVRVVDSRKVSVGVGLVVQAAGEAILAGADADTVTAAAEAAARATRVFGAPTDLEVAVRGGRVSAPAARIADLADLKPLIVFDDEGGAHTAGARVGFARTLRAMARKVGKYAAGDAVRVLVTHADGLEHAQYLRERLLLELDDVDIPIVQAGAVITTHVGLGTVAAAVRRIVDPVRNVSDTGGGEGNEGRV